MTEPTTWPTLVARYLAEIRAGLGALPRASRDEVVDGIAAHVNDRLADGETPEQVTAELGDPETIVAQAIEQFGGEAVDGRWLGPRRVGQLVAVALAVLTAVFVLFFIPAYSVATTTTVVEVTGPGGDPVPGEEQVTDSGPVSLLSWVGPFAIIGTSVPVLLTGIPLFARGRAGRPVAIACTALLAVFTVIASATIGWFYLPALLAAIIATILPDRRRTA